MLEGCQRIMRALIRANLPNLTDAVLVDNVRIRLKRLDIGTKRGYENEYLSGTSAKMQ